MRVLVAGDRGYLGAVIVPFLSEAGHDVVGLDAGWYDGCDFGPVPSGYEQRTGDVRDAVPDDLAGMDAVVNLAAISNDPVGHLNPQATYSVNAHGAVHLGRVAKAAGVERYVFASSCSLYGLAGDAPVTEDAAFNPVTPYGESKVMAEAGLAALADDSFSPTYLRNATAYGSSPRLRADIVVNNLTGIAFTRGEVRLQSDGSPWRPLVHAEDIARAVLAAIEAPRDVVHDRAFNVGRDEDVVQIRDIATQVAEALDAPVTFAEGAGPDKRDYRVDFSRIGQLLPAFEPRWTVAAGIDQLVRDMHDHGLTATDFEGPRFVRVEKVRELLAAGHLDDELRVRSSPSVPTSSAVGG
jgi:nucleoside-diphosphate-sugar epimerase